MAIRFSQRRAGFTLVELLVVIAIIGVLVALLLPAVQAAREAARRMQCSNNLKQMALACHNHQDTKQYLPGAARDGHQTYDAIDACCNSKTTYGYSWMYQILPFMEQSNVYDLASGSDQTTNAANPNDGLVRAALIPTFNCPTRRAPTLYSNVAKSDYAGNAGERNIAVGIRAGAPSNGSRGVIRQVDSSGWKVTIERIKDGSSNTLLLGEKALNDQAFGAEGGDNESWNNPGMDEDIVRWGGLVNGSVVTGLPPIQDKKGPYAANGWKVDPSVPNGNLFGQWQDFFGSSHPAGVNFALADGSVRFVPFNVDTLTFRYMSLADDGTPYTLP